MLHFAGQGVLLRMIICVSFQTSKLLIYITYIQFDIYSSCNLKMHEDSRQPYEIVKAWTFVTQGIPAFGSYPTMPIGKKLRKRGRFKFLTKNGNTFSRQLEFNPPTSRYIEVRRGAAISARMSACTRIINGGWKGEWVRARIWEVLRDGWNGGGGVGGWLEGREIGQSRGNETKT